MTGSAGSWISGDGETGEVGWGGDGGGGVS